MSAATQERVLTGVRWSSATRCVRKAFYEGTGAPAEPIPDYLLKRFRRGKLWEHAVKEDVAAQLAEQGRRIRREVEVPWPASAPIGVGHADFTIPSMKTAVEVFSTSGAAFNEVKAVQLAGYALNLKGIYAASLIVVDTHTGDDRTYPIDLAGLEPRVREIEETVVDAIKSGEAPARACSSPWDPNATSCPFRTACFADWQPTPLDELLGADVDLEDLAEADEALRRAKRLVERREERRDALRDRLRPAVPPGEELMAGGVLVKRTVSKPSRRFSLGDYEKAGYALPGTAEPFVKVSTSERWTVKRVEP